MCGNHLILLHPLDYNTWVAVLQHPWTSDRSSWPRRIFSSMPTLTLTWTSIQHCSSSTLCIPTLEKIIVRCHASRRTTDHNQMGWWAHARERKRRERERKSNFKFNTCSFVGENLRNARFLPVTEAPLSEKNTKIHIFFSLTCSLAFQLTKSPERVESHKLSFSDSLGTSRRRKKKCVKKLSKNFDKVN